VVLIVAKRPLNDLHILRGLTVIAMLIELQGVLTHVKGRSLSWRTVEQVGKILEAQHHLVALLRELDQLEITSEVCHHACHGRSVVEVLWCSIFDCEVGGIKDLEGLILQELRATLHRADIGIAEGEIVLGVDCDSPAIWLSLI